MNLFGLTLGEGNKKIGDVFSFSLPSRITCPGKSDWCHDHCNMLRLEKLRPNIRASYERNFKLTQNQEHFCRIVTGVLPRILPCVRLHVSGDFYSKKYIQSWIEICNAFPQTKFWAYTRSWIVPKLLPALEELRALPNVQLFASTDPSMREPPSDWRIAYVSSDPHAKGILCPEQHGKVNSCLDCGICFSGKKGNVIFKVH